MKYSVLIADDESNARNYLSRVVEEDEQFHLLGSKSNGLEVVKYCQTLMPDVLILDIEMPGLNGIEAARKVMKMNPQCLIIFTTAYNEYAISAFEIEAIGYLLKPFSQEDFSKVAKRSVEILKTREKASFNEQIERLWEKMRQPNPIYLSVIEIKNRGFVEEIKVDDIQYIHSNSEYAEIVTASEKHLHRVSLEQLSEQLPPFFRRIHRSYIINNNHVKDCQYLNNGTYQFQIKNGSTIVSSRSYQEAVKEFRNKK